MRQGQAKGPRRGEQGRGRLPTCNVPQLKADARLPRPLDHLERKVHCGQKVGGVREAAAHMGGG